MEYRSLGSLKVSLVGLGCNNFGWRTDAAGTAAVVDAALDAGVNFFDTADVYGSGQSEEFLGKALKGRRDKAIIATKFGMKMGEGKEGASGICSPGARRQSATPSDQYHRPLSDSSSGPEHADRRYHAGAE
jgi:aryl-alcohol dehydrogenase-like predicted oxidoreductase